MFTAQTLEMSVVVVLPKNPRVSLLTPSLINKSYSECRASPILILVKVIDLPHTSGLDVTILIILPPKINDSVRNSMFSLNRNLNCITLQLLSLPAFVGAEIERLPLTANAKISPEVYTNYLRFGQDSDWNSEKAPVSDYSTAV